MIDQDSNKELSRGTKSVMIVCGLYDMAVSMKSLQLKRQHPEKSEEWIFSEALRLMEEGCR